MLLCLLTPKHTPAAVADVAGGKAGEQPHDLKNQNPNHPVAVAAVIVGVGIAEDPDSLYQSMHAYLAGSGVDGVKVDCQAGVGLVGSCLGGGPAASRKFQAALEGSIATHFPGNHAINCMCHSSENFYRCVGRGWRGWGASKGRS